jgi:hypothetical protein
MNSEFKEKRKFPRHRIYALAQLEMFDGSLPVSVMELSVEGVRLHSNISVSPETHVAIRVNVGREIVFHGQVVWVLNEQTASGHIYKMGIQTDVILDRGDEIFGITEREILIQEIVILVNND